MNQNRFALLLIGSPKSGKTNLAFEFPKPLFLDCDMNIDAATRRHPKMVENTDYKRLIVDYDGEREIPLSKRWPRLLRLLEENWKDPAWDTLVIDSMTKIRNYLCDYLISETSAVKDLIIGGEKMMTINHWGPYATLMMRFVSSLRRVPKYVIFTAHIHSEKDESSGRWVFKPAVGGQSEDTIAGLFTDVWCCETQVTASTPQCPDGVHYLVRTVPTPQMVLGNSLGLPANFTFDFETFKKKIGEQK
jgi:hypothetical protein